MALGRLRADQRDPFRLLLAVENTRIGPGLRLARQGRFETLFHKLARGRKTVDGLVSRASAICASDQPSPCLETSAFNKILALSSRCAASRPVWIIFSRSARSSPDNRTTTDARTKLTQLYAQVG